jgi:Fe-S oxidoreductase
MAMRGDDKSLSFVEDTAVAPERLRDYIERFLEVVRRHGTVAGVYAHASVGCLHVRPVVNMKTDEGLRRFQAIANDIADLVLEFGGALSGEHGDGMVRGAFTEKMFGATLYEAFRAVKRTFDPSGIFNPGKIVDTPPLTANLRYGAAYVTPDPSPTFFDYSEYGGLGRAVEMCSGLGACRKSLDGTMCPSYMATREERHTTRGRANALRLAMNGTLDSAFGGRLADDDLREVLDLCLECRACKSECPVGVDVARFKSEFLAGYWRRHGMPLRTRMVGHARAIAEWGSRVAPVANAVARSAPMRWLNERLFDLDRRRTPPAWAAEPFVRQFASRRAATARLESSAAPTPPRPDGGVSSGREIVLFTDTFTNFYHPDIGTAACDVLEAAGATVRLAAHHCCGRPLISQGLLDEARDLAAANADALFDAVSRGEPIVFLEPSCLSAIREDAPSLLRGDLQRRASLVGQASVLFEEFLESQLSRGALSLALQPRPTTVLFHGHCHQKSMGLAKPALALLSRVPSATVVDLDAGCCGMAGSFGYGRDHYDVSRAIGERKLLPAARRMKANDVLVAAGTSCREQVAHFTGVKAVHPAVLLRSALEENNGIW